MDFEMNYKMHSSPEWIHDKGKGRVTIRGMSISMRVVPEFKDGIFSVKIVEDLNQEIKMRDYNVELEGQTDFSQAVDYTLNNFKQLF